jgi:hypothetical protein
MLVRMRSNTRILEVGYVFVAYKWKSFIIESNYQESYEI